MKYLRLKETLSTILAALLAPTTRRTAPHFQLMEANIAEIHKAIWSVNWVDRPDVQHRAGDACLETASDDPGTYQKLSKMPATSCYEVWLLDRF